MTAISHFALLLVCLGIASGAVHKIQTQHYALSGDHYKHLFGHASLRHQQLYRRKVGMHACVGKLPLHRLGYLIMGTITVGTPPQSFNVEVDAFYDNELILIGANANLSSVSKNIPEKNTYNADSSSTYVAVNGNISTWEIKGHKAQDVLNIGPVSATIKSFAVADKVPDKVPYALSYYPVDGILGLSPVKKSRLNVSVVAEDLVDQLDKPLISVYVNATISGNGTGQTTLAPLVPLGFDNRYPDGTTSVYSFPLMKRERVPPHSPLTERLPDDNITKGTILQNRSSFQIEVTLGAEDSENCESTWSYVPALTYFRNIPYTVHASSAKVTIGGKLTTVNLNSNVTFIPWPYFTVPLSVKDAFVNGTGATYNETIGEYTIDCDTTKAPLITLNIGGAGNSTDSTSRKLILSGADYIRYLRSKGVCYLGANFYSGGMWYLGSQVLNNHCISFNYKERTVGFADSKTPKTDVTKTV